VSYVRVLPRDLFNEANLLKCYGQLWLLLDNGAFPDASVEYDEDGSPFDVYQGQDTGAICLRNVNLVVRGDVCALERPLNSRRAWPLYAETPDGDVLDVFDDAGQFTPEMVAFLRGDGVEAATDGN